MTADGFILAKAALGALEGVDLAIDTGFADTARDELRDLAAEIDDENGGCHGNPCVVAAP